MVKKTSKKTENQVNEISNKIKTMEIRGALDIAIAAASAMKYVSDNSKADMNELILNLNSAAEKLKSARPSAVSLPNAVNYIVYLAKINTSKINLSNQIQEFINNQKNSLKKIAEFGSHLIEDNDTILTHCNSDTVVEILKTAYDSGKKITVVCTETRPRKQGYLTANALSKHGIPTTLIIDSAVHLMMKKLKVDKVIVGADTICSDGDVINKIGTSQVALCAKEMNIQFIVATQSIKFSTESISGILVKIEERETSEVADESELPGVKIINPAFDITDANYVDVIVTEFGVIPPQAAYSLLREKFGWKLNG
ncbi:MAG: ribose 1,5-bisphosphate isomerase [Candidatus Altiarchaeales archaeon HGW-Altiarchaeales-3]|nr:MAG: ribose 1,5-bisphosphate isomerase [Candidatus Altiarchaeales archaeon HGW-Altiarchaeales-3]